jgi:hypothetical protein
VLDTPNRDEEREAWLTARTTTRDWDWQAPNVSPGQLSKDRESQRIPLAVVQKNLINNEGVDGLQPGFYPDSTQLTGHFEGSTDEETP